MSEPRGSEPIRPWSPPSDPRQQPGQQFDPAEGKPTEPPWWQQIRRQTPPPPVYPAGPQGAPYQQLVHTSVQQPPAQQSPDYPPQYAQQPAAQPKRSTQSLLIAGGVLAGAIVAAVVVVGLLTFGDFGGQVLNVSKAQEAVKQVITDPIAGYGIANVTDVTCNDGKNPAAKKGAGFTCEVTVDGKKHQVRALFIDDNGTYEVDRPR
jgi:Domain of unknown function (DUF4333)